MKSISARSSLVNFAGFAIFGGSVGFEGFGGVESEARAASALERFVASSASRRWARPQVQSLHARRRFPVRGRHSGAVGKGGVVSF